MRVFQPRGTTESEKGRPPNLHNSSPLQIPSDDGLSTHPFVEEGGSPSICGMAWGPLFSCRGNGYEREDGVRSEPFRCYGFWGAVYVSGLMLFLMLKPSAYKALYGFAIWPKSLSSGCNLQSGFLGVWTRVEPCKSVQMWRTTHKGIEQGRFNCCATPTSKPISYYLLGYIIIYFPLGSTLCRLAGHG